MAGFIGTWGPRQEQLHPRGFHGRFIRKFNIPEILPRILKMMDAAFHPRSFGSQGQASQYLFNQGKPGRFGNGVDYRRLHFDFDEANAHLQQGDIDPSTQRYVDMMEHNATTLPDDIITAQSFTPETLGMTPEQMNEPGGDFNGLIGAVIADRGYSAVHVGASPNHGPGQILLTIATPKGTRVIVPGRNRNDSGLFLDRDQPLLVTSVSPDGRGGWYMMAVAMPIADLSTRRSNQDVPNLAAPRGAGLTPQQREERIGAPQAPDARAQRAGTPPPLGAGGQVTGENVNAPEQPAPPSPAPAQAAPSPPASPAPAGRGQPPPRNEPVHRNAVGGTGGADGKTPSEIAQTPVEPAPGSSPESVAAPAPQAVPNEHVARARQKADVKRQYRKMATSVPVADAMQEIEELSHKKQDNKVIAEHIRGIISDPSMDEVPKDERDRLKQSLEEAAAHFDNGKPNQGRQRLASLARELDLSPGDKPGSKVDFDPSTMDSVSDVPDGSQVEIIRPSVIHTDPDTGAETVVSKGRVRPVGGAAPETGAPDRQGGTVPEPGPATVEAPATPTPAKKAAKKAGGITPAEERVVERAKEWRGHERNDEERRIVAHADKILAREGKGPAAPAPGRAPRTGRAPMAKKAPAKATDILAEQEAKKLERAKALHAKDQAANAKAAERARVAEEKRAAAARVKEERAAAKAAAPAKAAKKAAPAKDLTPEQQAAAEVQARADEAQLPSSVAGLRAAAKEQGIKGFSTMRKEQLQRALLGEDVSTGTTKLQVVSPEKMVGHLERVDSDSAARTLLEKHTLKDLKALADQVGIDHKGQKLTTKDKLKTAILHEVRGAPGTDFEPVSPAEAVSIRDVKVPDGPDGDMLRRGLVEVDDTSPESLRDESERLESHATQLRQKGDRVNAALYQDAADRMGMRAQQISGMEEAPKPVKRARKAAVPKAKETAAETGARVRAAADEATAREALKGKTALELKAIADDVKAPYGSSWTKSRIEDSIVEHGIRRRLDGEAIANVDLTPKGPRVPGTTPLGLEPGPAANRIERIAKQRGRGTAFAHIHQVVADGGSDRAIQSVINSNAKRFGLSDAEKNGLLKAHSEGRLSEEIQRLAGVWGLEQMHATNDVIPYDPEQHRGIGGNLRRGTPVSVVRPGFRDTQSGDGVIVNPDVMKASKEDVDKFRAAQTRARKAVAPGSVPGPRAQAKVTNQQRADAFRTAWDEAGIPDKPGRSASRTMAEIRDRVHSGDWSPEEGIRRLEVDIDFNKTDVAEIEAVLRDEQLDPAERKDLTSKLAKLHTDIAAQEKASKFMRRYFRKEPEVTPAEAKAALDPEQRSWLDNADPEEVREGARLQGLGEVEGNTAEEVFDNALRKIIERELGNREKAKAKKAAKAAKKSLPKAEPKLDPEAPDRLDVRQIGTGIDFKDEDKKMLDDIQQRLDAGESPASIGKDWGEQNRAFSPRTRRAMLLGVADMDSRIADAKEQKLPPDRIKELEDHKATLQADAARLQAQAERQEELGRRLQAMRPAKKTAPNASNADDRLHAAWQKLASPASTRGQRRVSIAALREELADVPRAEQDAALRRILSGPGALETQENQQQLTTADRAAALRVGARTYHFLTFDNPADAKKAAPNPNLDGLSDDELRKILDSDQFPDAQKDRIRSELTAREAKKETAEVQARLLTTAMERLEAARTEAQVRDAVKGLTMPELKVVAGKYPLDNVGKSKESLTKALVQFHTNRANFEVLTRGGHRENPIEAGRFSDKPTIPNNWGTQSGDVAFHDDGPVGQALLGLGQEAKLEVDGDSLENTVGRLATRSVRGQISSQQFIDDLKAIHARLPEGRAKQQLGSAIREIDTPKRDPLPLPPGTPAPMVELMQMLSGIPLARDIPRGRRTSAMQELQKIAQELASGERLRGGADTAMEQRLYNTIHESYGAEGKFEIDRAVRRAIDQMRESRRRPS